MPLRDFLDEVEEFALGEYWSALAQGDRLDDERRKQVAERRQPTPGSRRGSSTTTT